MRGTSRRASADLVAPVRSGLDELGDERDVLLRVREVRQVSVTGQGLAGGLREDSGQLLEDRGEERRALGAAGEQDRALEAGQSLRVQGKRLRVAGLVEERRGVVEQRAL